MKDFPTLFKLTSTNAIQYWKISVEEFIGNYGKIITEYGQLGTDKPQITTDVISVGKNNGKANETTPYEQATKEAEATWQKKLKSGYVKSEEEATSGKVDSIIEGGVLPMLAFTFEDYSNKIKYPAYISRKLDGVRCLAIVKNGKCSLWTRQRHAINTMPIINGALEKLFPKEDIILDGELFSASLPNFEKLISIVKNEKPDFEKEIDRTRMEYHIFDIVSKDSFSTNVEKLKTLHGKDSKIKIVEQLIINSKEEAIEKTKEFITNNYEGGMIRNKDSIYQNKRSYDLLKLKFFKEDEFPIVGIKEGRGKLKGHVGSFICSIGKDTFDVKMDGSTSRLKEYFETPNLWKGKLLTITFQNYTKNGSPRFPIGKCIRSYE